MSKPALGRGLGDLMSKATGPKTIPNQPQVNEPAAGPGVSSLLKGSRPDIFSESEEAQAVQEVVRAPVVEKSNLPFPLWYLFAGDIVLLLFAFLLVFKDPAALDWKRICLASVATVLGGALAFAGVLLGQKKE